MYKKSEFLLWTHSETHSLTLYSRWMLGADAPVVPRLSVGQTYRWLGRLSWALQSLCCCLSGELWPLPSSPSASFALLQMLLQTRSKLSFGTSGWIHTERGKGGNAPKNRFGVSGIQGSSGSIIFSVWFARMGLVSLQRSAVYCEPGLLKGNNIWCDLGRLP